MQADICTNGPSSPIGNPADLAAINARPVPTKALKDRNLKMLRPDRIALISGMPDPSDSLLQRALYRKKV
jgi:hypothetical protein